MMIVNGETRIFGVVGDPVKQVKTPSEINGIFKNRGENVISVPFHVAPSEFDKFWLGMKASKNVIGFGITVPHKSKAMGLCDSLGASAEQIGVVNVVRRQPNGDFHGDIFDGNSFVSGLIANGCDPAGHSVYMYGAGGAATAICYALIDAGVKRIAIQNRTKSNAENLVAQLREKANFASARRVDDFDEGATLCINASSVGMNVGDALPFDANRLTPNQIIAEVVANPEKTNLLVQAEARGCTIHSGIHMITNQIEILADFVLGAKTLP